MKVQLTIGDAEIREAVRTWAEQHGVPNAIVNSLKFRAKTKQAGYFDEAVELQLLCEYEAESLSTHEGWPIPPKTTPTKKEAYE